MVPLRGRRAERSLRRGDFLKVARPLLFPSTSDAAAVPPAAGTFMDRGCGPAGPLGSCLLSRTPALPEACPCEAWQEWHPPRPEAFPRSAPRASVAVACNSGSKPGALGGRGRGILADCILRSGPPPSALAAGSASQAGGCPAHAGARTQRLAVRRSAAACADHGARGGARGGAVTGGFPKDAVRVGAEGTRRGGSPPPPSRVARGSSTSSRWR